VVRLTCVGCNYQFLCKSGLSACYRASSLDRCKHCDIHLRGMQLFDANLLIALDALLDTGSVTQAAERMNVSVPAMSRTLQRIRKLMGDPIMVQAGRGLVPTPRALEVRARVHELVREAQSLIQARTVPLTKVARSFTIRAGDSFVATFASAILEEVHKGAPGITLRFVAQGEAEIGPLREGIIDLDVGHIRLRGPEIKVQSLFIDKFMGVVRAGHPLSRATVTAKHYVGYEHISASRRGLLSGPIDEALAKLGLKRNVTLVVPTFLSALMAAATSDLVATVQEHENRSTASLCGLYVFPLPVATNALRISQAWHPRFDADPVHRFVRECVLRICKIKVQ
jgi:DNA-binding transcriptional LysR family regulator